MTGGRPAQTSDQLVRMICTTLAEQGLWPAVMEQMRGLFDAQGASLIHRDFGAKKATCVAYNGAMNRRNPWLHSGMPYRPDTVFLGTEIRPNDNWYAPNSVGPICGSWDRSTASAAWSPAMAWRPSSSPSSGGAANARSAAGKKRA